MGSEIVWAIPWGTIELIELGNLDRIDSEKFEELKKSGPKNVEEALTSISDAINDGKIQVKFWSSKNPNDTQISADLQISDQRESGSFELNFAGQAKRQWTF